MSEWIGTANKGYSPYAMEELRRLASGAGFVQLLPGEAFLMRCEPEADELHAAIAQHEPTFLRHIQPVDRKMDIHGDAEDLGTLSDMIRQSRLRLKNRKVAVHIRRSQSSPFPYSAADTKAVLDAVLEEIGAEPAVQGPEVIIAIFAADDTLYAGFGTPGEMLSDWPGGAIRFKREEGQISRAKFKLLEAERTFGLDYGAYRHALDIGAAPGGWTSLLLERGLQVTAVDPAELHHSLRNHPDLVHLKRNAADVSLAPRTFDLLVCDMSWSPILMTKLILDLKDALAPYATAVITVKLMHRKPMGTIREVKERLGTAFEVLRAKQLFHNRDEITLVLQKKQ
ncbi:SAM-dependent methyltransferase [Paenibacillus sp. J5C_2022]|uniref:SAM-dependent methyltransferase n=1 Tax=Paenibacillus sp. J5C2022 TaxID=2977129 RepID=UPI0021CE631A|nr:SAM-dependent methyltransferase [Paenibacillus sp. J5C2022]MCU6708191.1 SAM-dependent methyltransferase [Paenibacillus sp. J5C2022]